jgi:hypothetical protein
MEWLPSLRALLIFGSLLAIFAIGYWACAGHSKMRASLPTGATIGTATPWLR